MWARADRVMPDNTTESPAALTSPGPVALRRAAIPHRSAGSEHDSRTQVPQPGWGSRAAHQWLMRLDEGAGGPLEVSVPVSSPSDPAELQAAAVAAEVAASGSAPMAVSAEATSGLPRVAAALPRPDLPSPLGTALTGGRALSDAERAPLEAALGADLSMVKVHTGSAAATAAALVSARAFTVGSSIVLGAGESTTDVALMSHEATHVLQGSGGIARLAVTGTLPTPMIMRSPVIMTSPMIMRDGEQVEDDSLIPAWLMDSIRTAVRQVPGYQVASIALGSDLLTGQPLGGSVASQLEEVLAEGPFGAGIAAVLETCEVIGEVAGLVTAALAAHQLTLARVAADLGQAWDEIRVIDGVDPNVAIVARYVRAFVADVVAAATDVAAAVVTLVRQAIVSLVEPLLTSSAVAPLWQLFCKVVHYDPLRGVEVDASTMEIMTDFLHLVGQDDALARMTENGTLQRSADWVDTQLGTFLGLLVTAQQLFLDAWAAISPANLAELPNTLPTLVDRAGSLVGQIVSFVVPLVVQIVELIKDALLARLSGYAHETRGFRLLTVVLNEDPFTHEVVERTPEAIIGGFITLLPGGEQTFADLSESGVIAQAGERISTAMTELGISTEMVTGLFADIWASIGLADLADPIGCFVRIVQRFGEPLGRLVTFAAVVVQVVIELVLQVMNFPSELLGSIISGVQQAVDDIAADPVRFLNSLIEALKAGFLGFLGNIATHLLAGLTAWLFRGLGALGITIPSEITGESVLGLIADVLGLSADLLWERLGAQIGEDRVEAIRGAIDQLTGAWAFIADVQDRGFAAIWDFVSGQLSNLWEMILSAAEDWIMQTVVERAIAKVISMLDPTGVMAVINSAIAFFNAVQSVIEYVTDILQIVKRWVDTVAAIAAGNIAPGAVQLEAGLASAIPVAIGFLANQVGLGNIPERLVEIIAGLREQVVAAIDWVIAQALRLGRAVIDALGFGADPATADPATEDPAAAVPLTEADHPAYALAAGQALIAALAASADSNPDGVAAAYVAAHEDELSLRLSPGIRLRFELPESAVAAAADGGQLYAFDVVIAPNTTVVHHDAVVNPLTVPGTSAEGIGNQGRHGSQPPRHWDSQILLHHLTSEHIIPFALGACVWEQVGQVSPHRSGWEDKGQTTLMIYRGAAGIKTSGTSPVTGETERFLIAEFRRQSTAAGLAARADAARGYYDEMSGSGEAAREQGEVPARDLLDVIGQALASARDLCVAVTVDAILQEHQTTDSAIGMDNGARRGETDPIPDVTQVRAAAADQIASIMELVSQSLLGREPSPDRRKN